ncbi:AAA family ATPase [Sorangium sp. So ce1000]|uniref:AAA family ATPase n=1 Tax=Sorangium sp. So ce1000 TaxID=3133325 RepID=UPI003F5D8F3E
MDRPYVEQLRIQGYGCVQDATLELTPLHALIGPNDSGKSTVLRALRTLSSVLERALGAPALDSLGRAAPASKAPDGAVFEVSAASTTWRVELDAGGRVRSMSFPRDLEPPSLLDDADGDDDASGGPTPERPALDIVQALRGAQMLRLDPDALRAPHPLIPDGHPLCFADERGTGLPAVYDAVISRDLSAYIDLNEELTRLFPSVRSLHLANPSSTTKAIGVKLEGGAVVPAALMSEGMLYYLAFAALPHLDPTPLLLVEEPEHGLHPARIADVMRALRLVSEKTQVLLATHSPLVVNELQPEEVTVVTRAGERGMRATRILDTPGFEDRARVYALGELWLSYANGGDEAPLLGGGPRP